MSRQQKTAGQCSTSPGGYLVCASSNISVARTPGWKNKEVRKRCNRQNSSLKTRATNFRFLRPTESHSKANRSNAPGSSLAGVVWGKDLAESWGQSQSWLAVQPRRRSTPSASFSASSNGREIIATSFVLRRFEMRTMLSPVARGLEKLEDMIMICHRYSGAQRLNLASKPDTSSQQRGMMALGSAWCEFVIPFYTVFCKCLLHLTYLYPDNFLIAR